MSFTFANVFIYMSLHYGNGNDVLDDLKENENHQRDEV